MAVDALTFDVTTDEAPAPPVTLAAGPPPTPAVAPASAPSRAPAFYTGIAVFDGQQWMALCRELDISSVGATAQAAIQNLREAVELAIEVATENNLSPGSEVPEDELRDFMLSHERQHSISVLTFRA